MVYVFFADGFEEVEALSIVDVLRRAKIDVQMIGIKGKRVRGAHDISIEMDAVIEDVQEDDLMDALILPGGMPGTTNLMESDRLGELLKFAEKNGKVIAAICAAPSALAHFRVMEGKKATCYPGYETKMESYIHVTDNVVQDGLLITGKGVGVALEFALQIVKELKDEFVADTLKKNMIL